MFIHIVKDEISDKSFQVISAKKMESKNLQAIYCEDGGEYRVYCDICDKLCIKRFYKNKFKSQTETDNFREKLPMLFK